MHPISLILFACLIGGANAQCASNKFWSAQDCTYFMCRNCGENEVQYCAFQPVAGVPAFGECLDEVCVCDKGFFAVEKRYNCESGPYNSIYGASYPYNADNVYAYPHLFEDVFKCQPCPVGKYCQGGAELDWLPKLMERSGIGYAWRGVSHKQPTDCTHSLMISTSDHTGCMCPPGSSLWAFGSNGEVNCRCDPGSFWNKTIDARVISCSECPKGSYCEDGYEEKLCPEFLTTNAKGAKSLAECSSCEKAATCNPGSYCSPPLRAGEKYVCIPCPKGTFCTRDKKFPQNCGPGFYQNSTGQTSCIPCSKGTASSEEGRTTPCDPCQQGWYQPTDKGGTDAKQCTRCSPGTYQPNMGASECILCSSGKYQPLLSATSCIDCPAGYASTGKPASPTIDLACRLCGAGNFTSLQSVSADGKTVTMVCKMCPSGKFNPFVGQGFCMDCPGSSIYITSNEGSTSPDQCYCNPGTSYLSSSTGVCTPCSTCGRGTYMSSTVCNPSDAIALPKCTACGTCPANSYIHPDYVCTGVQIK